MDETRREETVADGVAPEDVGIDRPMAATIQDVIATRLGRRDLRHPEHTLAGPRAGRAAAPGHRGDHQAGRGEIGS